MLPPFWEKLTHPVLKHQKCGGTFKAVKNIPPQSHAYINGFYLFTLVLNPTQTQILNPTSSATALNSRVRHIVMLPPAPGTLKPACKECLSTPLTPRKIHYLNTTHYNLVSLAELIILPQKHSSVNPSFTGFFSFMWILTQSDELVTSSLRH